ncbi:GntR family transcriptional regulator [Streptomyces cavourensis]
MSQSTHAYEQVKAEIIAGELGPGVHLNEVRLAERIGVSRTPLRAALQRLDREGLVRTVSGRGLS